MITIELTESELKQVIKALQTRAKKKTKRADTWYDRVINETLLIPKEVAEAFITVDFSTARLIHNLIDKLESHV